MSIEKRVYPPSKRHPRKRTAWRVRWKENGAHRSREVATFAEARALQAAVARGGDEKGGSVAAAAASTDNAGQPQLMLLPDGRVVQLVEMPILAAPTAEEVAPELDVPQSPTLAEFWREWIEHRALRSAPSTISTYENAWQCHVEPVLGSLRLDEIEQQPRVLSDLMAQLGRVDPKTNKVRVGAPTRRKVFMLLKCVLRSAVAWNHISANPMDRLDERAPSQKRQRKIVVFSAVHVEQMRRSMLARTSYRGGMIRDLPFPARNLRDAALLTTLAYCGLRPAEALALRWSDLDLEARTLYVLGRNSDSVRREVKSVASEREVPIPRATADDLAALHAALGRPAASELVFGIDGEMWGKEQWRRWASKTFKPEACAIGRIGARPYDLRHSFVLRLIVQGKTVPEVACLAGHTPTVTTDVYLGAYREFEQIGIVRDDDLDTHFLAARTAAASMQDTA